MIGNNELIVNQATMKEIVQYWLNEFAPDLNSVVESVRLTDGTSFSIQLKAKESIGESKDTK